MRRCNRMVCFSAVMGVLSLAASPVRADHSDVAIMDAKVLDVVPLYHRQVYKEPSRYCERRATRQHPHKTAAGTLLGGVVGAAIGHELGREVGHRGVGSLVGAVVGAQIASDHSRTDPDREERCHAHDDVEHAERLIGYRVLYSLNGERFETETQQHPGRRLRVRVHVEPLDE